MRGALRFPLHLITQSVGQGECGRTRNSNARDGGKVGLRCGQREGAACGLASQQRDRAGRRREGPLADFCQLFVGAAPPWEAGILVSRTTRDARGIEEQVLSGSKPGKWINRC